MRYAMKGKGSAMGAVKLPPFEEFQTSGGLSVVIARREPIPLVGVRLVIRAGAATDPAGRHGLADFTAPSAAMAALRTEAAFPSPDEASTTVRGAPASGL